MRPRHQVWRRRLAAAAAIVLAVPGLPDTARASDEATWDGLPPGEGREEVHGLCSACHSLMIVKQQGLDRGSWAETLDWMVEEQGMPEQDRDTLARLLDYLAEHYGVDR